MARWLAEHRRHDGSLIGSISPRDLRFTLRKGKDGPHDVTYTLPFLRDNEELSLPELRTFIRPYATDFYLSRTNRNDVRQLIMSGIHTDHQIVSEREYTEVAGKSWEHYLELREYPFDPLNPNLYRYTAGGYGMTTNPERGLAAQRLTMNVRDVLMFLLDTTILAGSSTRSLADFSYSIPTFPESADTWEMPLGDTSKLMDHLNDFAQERDTGFDFWIDVTTVPLKVFRVAAPSRAVATASPSIRFTSDPGDNTGLLSVQWSDRGPGANHFVGYGSGNDVKLGLMLEDTAAQDEFRRIDANEDFGDVDTRFRVNRLTADAWARQKFPYQDITIKVFPEAYGDSFWERAYPGAIATVDVDLHHIGFAENYEIDSMDCTVSNEGDELVDMNLQPIYNPSYGDVPDYTPVDQGGLVFF